MKPFTFISQYIDIANILTIGNLCVGFAAVNLTSVDHNIAAAALIACAASIDHVDGWLARRFCADNIIARRFGAHLDTLSDAVCFVVAPSLLFISINRSVPAYIFVSILFFLCGIARLAHFEITGAQGGRIYEGLPTTYAGYICALAMIALQFKWIDAYTALLFVLIIAIMQILAIRIVKPSNIITMLIMPACLFVELATGLL